MLLLLLLLLLLPLPVMVMVMVLATSLPMRTTARAARTSPMPKRKRWRRTTTGARRSSAIRRAWILFPTTSTATVSRVLKTWFTLPGHTYIAVVPGGLLGGLRAY